MPQTTYIASFIKDNRDRQGLTQEQLAEKAGVGLRFIRDLEQGKQTVRLDKVNQVLALFGYALAPSRELDPYWIQFNHFNKHVRVLLKNKAVLDGFIIGQAREGHEIAGWKFVSNNHAIGYQATKKPELVQEIRHSDIESIENLSV